MSKPRDRSGSEETTGDELSHGPLPEDRVANCPARLALLTTDEAGGGIAWRRAAIGTVVVVFALGAASYAVDDDRHSFHSALHRIGILPLVAAFAFDLIGVGATFPAWHQMLRGLGVRIETSAAGRVYFTTQLGKYLPGSVWPVVMQMEAGRSHGANRRTMLCANLLTIALGCGTGLVVASALLPLYDVNVLETYWWGLLALPVLIVMLHPRMLPGLLDRVFVVLRRPKLNLSLGLREELHASAWFLASWIALGGQISVLAISVTHGGPSEIFLSIGGMALATSLGILFIPAPAGAGIRDAVLALVLSTKMPGGTALAIAITSRLLLIGSDFTLAGAAYVAAWVRQASARPERSPQ